MDTNQNAPLRTVGRILTATAFVVLVSGVLIACSTQSSYLKMSYSVEDQFERSRLYEGLRYYYSGTMDDPLALVALEPDVVLESADWKPTEMTSKKLDSWIQAFKLEPWIEYNQKPDGAVMADPKGNHVGYFYSVWRYPQVRFVAANRIEIDRPIARLRITNRHWADDNFGLGFDGSLMAGFIALQPVGACGTAT